MKFKMTPNQTVWIVTLFVLLISIMIGYSALDNNMSINGRSTISTTTLIRISKLEVKSSSNNVEVSSNIDGNIKGVMETIFTGSGTATFTGTVVNMGSAEAILSTINLMNESNNSSPTCITMSVEGLKVGDTLTPSQEQNFTVTVTSTCAEASTKTNEFSLSYIPVNPSEGTTTIDERITNLENLVTTLQTENTSLKSQTSTLNTKVSTLTTTVNNNKILNAYPVGSIYISTSSTNPGNFIGGTWEAYGTGRTLVGIDTSQTEFNTVNKTGGEKTHTLTVNEMPSHRHNGEGGPIMVAGTGNRNQIGTGSNARYGYTDYQGKDQPHNNLQPYIVTYMWKRTK